MPPQRILISGAGIAGSVTAYWLGLAGFNVTVVERNPELRTAGQGIDMEGAAVEIIKKMGLEETIRGKTTGELGLSFVDENDKAFATFDVGDRNTDIGFTSDIEIMRGDLCNIFYTAANAFSNVTFLFNTSITSLHQTPSTVTITTSTGKEETYDMLIAADGFRSATRRLVLDNPNSEAFIQSQNCWVAYFSIPRQPQDHPRSRGYNAIGGRFIMIRPKDEKLSSGYFIVSRDEPCLRAVQRAGMEAQKAALAELFADAGWEATRVIQGMKDTEDFYLQDVARIQLGMQGWSKGRCAMVGDAAYCSFTGTGTTLAILGGYMLAGEILQKPEEPEVAFKAYEDKLAGYVKKAQSAPKGGPQLFVPQTRLGVWMIRTAQWLVYWSGITRWIGGYKMPKFDLPDYSFDSRVGVSVS
ncbi:oxidoreductase [Aureobasidium subglaciale]|nr:oxidoreductase [Aureobasidium subglaciale]